MLYIGSICLMIVFLFGKLLVLLKLLFGFFLNSGLLFEEELFICFEFWDEEREGVFFKEWIVLFFKLLSICGFRFFFWRGLFICWFISFFEIFLFLLVFVWIDWMDSVDVNKLVEIRDIIFFLFMFLFFFFKI